MKIAIDISAVIYGTGVSTYTRNLVKALAKIDKKNDYLLWGGSLRRKKELEEFGHQVKKINPRFKTKILSLPPTLADFLFNRTHLLKIEKLIGPVDVMHTSDWTEPPAKAAKVTTIHDLSFLKNDQEVDPQILKVHRRRLHWVKKESQLVIAVSQATRQEIIRLLKIPAQRIKVIYEAAGPEVKRVTDQKTIDQVKKEYGIVSSYLLVVSPRQPRKNFARIIKAFQQLKESQSELKLVVIGESPVKVNSSNGIVFTGFVPQGDKMNALYSGAECLVYPSLYEGFGLPILEAFTCGCPVVTSNVSSMPEVAGQAAVLVNPQSVTAIARGINQALNEKDFLIEAGLKQVRKFSWDKTARETLKIYEEAFQANQKK